MYLNDTRIATWRFRFEQSTELPAEISVPRRALRNSGIAFPTFVISSPRSPTEFHVSDDPNLELHLRSIALNAGGGPDRFIEQNATAEDIVSHGNSGEQPITIASD